MLERKAWDQIKIYRPVIWSVILLLSDELKLPAYKVYAALAGMVKVMAAA